MPSVSAKTDQGAVTAEFMMLAPVIVLGVSVVLGAVSLGFGRLELQALSFSVARQDAMGLQVPTLEGIEVEIDRVDRLSCIQLSKTSMIPIQARSCQLILGY